MAGLDGTAIHTQEQAVPVTAIPTDIEYKGVASPAAIEGGIVAERRDDGIDGAGRLRCRRGGPTQRYDQEEQT